VDSRPSDPRDPAALAARLESLLATLRGDPRAHAVAEDLVRSLMQFYGAAWRRAVDLLRETDPRAVPRLAADPLLLAILILHDLHPDDADAPATLLQIQRADGTPVPLARSEARS
jgi:hypothetical protein